ncbi:MAG: hypothetical protein V5A60_07700 [Haloarculaceae archaeon]
MGRVRRRRRDGGDGGGQRPARRPVRERRPGGRRLRERRRTGPAGRVEAIGCELEAGAVPPAERADRIAEGKRLVADLERGLETPEEVEESLRTGPSGAVT